MLLELPPAVAQEAIEWSLPAVILRGHTTLNADTPLFADPDWNRAASCHERASPRDDPRESARSPSPQVKPASSDAKS